MSTNYYKEDVHLGKTYSLGEGKGHAWVLATDSIGHKYTAHDSLITDEYGNSYTAQEFRSKIVAGASKYESLDGEFS